MNPKTKLLCVSGCGFVIFSNQILDSLYDFDITYYKTFVPVRYQCYNTAAPINLYFPHV